MKYFGFLLALSLVLVCVSAQVNVQQILIEETNVYQNDFVTINYKFMNNKDLDIVNIKLVDKYPKDKFKGFEECYNCELIEIKDDGDYKALVIKVEDIKPNSNVEVSYSVDLNGGEYYGILGEKYYDYMNQTQHRLGKDRLFDFKEQTNFGLYILSCVTIIIIVIVFLLFKKKRSSKILKKR